MKGAAVYLLFLVVSLPVLYDAVINAPLFLIATAIAIRIPARAKW